MTDKLPPIEHREGVIRPMRYDDFNLRDFWMAAYRALDEKHWLVLTERYIHERTYVDIAHQLGLSDRQIRRICGEAMDMAMAEMQKP